MVKTEDARTNIEMLREVRRAVQRHQRLLETRAAQKSNWAGEWHEMSRLTWMLSDALSAIISVVKEHELGEGKAPRIGDRVNVDRMGVPSEIKYERMYEHTKDGAGS